MGCIRSLTVKGDVSLVAGEHKFVPRLNENTIGHGVKVLVSGNTEHLSIHVKTDKHWGVKIISKEERDVLKAVKLEGGLVSQGEEPLVGISHVLTSGGKKIKFREADAGVTDGFSWRVERVSVNTVNLVVERLAK